MYILVNSLDISHDGVCFNTSRSKVAVHQAMRQSFGPELDMMADVLEQHEHQPEGSKGRVNTSDLNFVLKIQRKMLSLVVKQTQQAEEEQAKRRRQSVRYLKRSSNQLTRVRHQMTQVVDLYRSPYFFTTTKGSFARF
jgi:hypothetical protein